MNSGLLDLVLYRPALEKKNAEPAVRRWLFDRSNRSRNQLLIQKRVVVVAFLITAIKGVLIRLVECGVSPESLYQVRIGDIGDAESHQVRRVIGNGFFAGVSAVSPLIIRVPL
jgi:hypothetical protein